MDDHIKYSQLGGRNGNNHEKASRSKQDEVDWHSIPNGGFPNLYKRIVDKTIQPEPKKEISKREPSEAPKKVTMPQGPKADNPIINIKDILLKRRHVEPFVDISQNDEASQ